MKSLAVIILSIVLTNCAFGQTRGGAAVPRELVGKWYKGSTSALQFLDRRTGISDAAGGDGFSLEFTADGKFIKAGMMKTGAYGCSVVVFGYETGKFKVAGSTLTLNGADNFISYKDSCNPQTNSEKNKPPRKFDYPFEIRADEDGRTQLCLGFEGGEDCFTKDESE